LPIGHGRGEDEELMMEEAQALVSTSRTAADDVIIMDDPIIRVNIGNMLRKIMQDFTSWKAIWFLESLQQTI
jgi:phosphopantothenate synthetase